MRLGNPMTIHIIVAWVFIGAGFGIGYLIAILLAANPIWATLIGSLVGHTSYVCLCSFLAFRDYELRESK
jgi:hypothetical protein